MFGEFIDDLFIRGRMVIQSLSTRTTTLRPLGVITTRHTCHQPSTNTCHSTSSTSTCVAFLKKLL